VVGLGGVLAFTGPDIWLTALGLRTAFIFLAAGGVSMASLQIITPAPIRGRISAIYLLVTTITGATMGPPIVAAFTQFVFRGGHMVGMSIACTYALFTPVAVLAFVVGKSELRKLTRQDS
jgi:hypothetical protein